MPHSTPTVSVIVPAYNVAPYIAEALASLQAQTLDAFEAIIIDDGSTDATAAAIAPFLADPRFRLVRTANCGLSAARNRGIAEARGPLVALLDGDDRYRPDYLARMVAALGDRPDAAFVTCDAVSFADADPRRERFSARYAQDEPITLARLLGGEVAIFGLCTIRAATLRDLGGYDEGLRAAEDLDLWLRLLAAGHGGGLLRDVLVEYRRRASPPARATPRSRCANSRQASTASSPATSAAACSPCALAGSRMATANGRRRCGSFPGCPCWPRPRSPTIGAATSSPNPWKELAMTIAVGDRIPPAILIKVTDSGPESVYTNDYFAGRRVALFSVPGAFTPTCSARHLPSFVDRLDELKGKGIDEVAATAVNDSFVMSAWASGAGAGGITMLADGNAEFVTALGLTMDGSQFGMGTRGQRFSMIVNDGVVEQLNVEAPGEYKVSSAEHMLGQL